MGQLEGIEEGNMKKGYSKLYWEAYKVEEVLGEYNEEEAEHMCFLLSWDEVDLSSGEEVEFQVLKVIVDPNKVKYTKEGKLRTPGGAKWYIYRQCLSLLERAEKLRR